MTVEESRRMTVRLLQSTFTPSLEREGWGELTRPITEQLLNLWSKEVNIKH